MAVTTGRLCLHLMRQLSFPLDLPFTLAMPSICKWQTAAGTPEAAVQASPLREPLLETGGLMLYRLLPGIQIVEVLTCLSIIVSLYKT